MATLNDFQRQELANILERWDDADEQPGDLSQENEDIAYLLTMNSELIAQIETLTVRLVKLEAWAKVARGWIPDPDDN